MAGKCRRHRYRAGSPQVSPYAHAGDADAVVTRREEPVQGSAGDSGDPRHGRRGYGNYGRCNNRSGKMPGRDHGVISAGIGNVPPLSSGGGEPRRGGTRPWLRPRPGYQVSRDFPGAQKFDSLPGTSTSTRRAGSSVSAVQIHRMRRASPCAGTPGHSRSGT